MQAGRGSEDDYASRRRSSASNPRRQGPDQVPNKKKRRQGRPAWKRSPDDSPFRDGNRDRLIGLLTERSAKTLAHYLMETNLNVYHWLLAYIAQYPIPRDGTWDDVSGETFLRTLLTMPVQPAKFMTGRTSMYDNIKETGVDPRSIAQRIMEIRKQLAMEWMSDLGGVPEENASLLRESLTSSLEKMWTAPATSSDDDDVFIHPEMVEEVKKQEEEAKNQEPPKPSS